MSTSELVYHFASPDGPVLYLAWKKRQQHSALTERGGASKPS